MTLSQYSPLLRDGFTVWMVTRKQNMPANYTIGDMAHDYATLINAEFDRSVDVVLGTSFGGLVAQYLAADHPGCFRHLVVASAGWTVSEEGKTLEQDYANSLSEGKRWKAATILMNGMFPNLPYRWMARVGGALFAPMVSGGHEYFAHDVVVEAEAEMGFDSRAVLPHITVPVLLIAGDKDFYFPRHIVEATARLIPGCTLKLYGGKGHFGAIADRRLALDVLEFANR
jgi:pimeloyl-ACP methyl ester carboxylesterase